MGWHGRAMAIVKGAAELARVRGGWLRRTGRASFYVFLRQSLFSIAAWPLSERFDSSGFVPSFAALRLGGYSPPFPFLDGKGKQSREEGRGRGSVSCLLVPGVTRWWPQPRCGWVGVGVDPG
jgi:hypothetical protein